MVSISVKQGTWYELKVPNGTGVVKEPGKYKKIGSNTLGKFVK